MSTPHSSAAAGPEPASGREDGDSPETPEGAESLLTHSRRSLRSKVSAWSASTLDAGIRILQSLRKHLCGEADAGEEKRGSRRGRTDGRDDEAALAPAAPARHRLRSALIGLGLLLAGGAGGGALAPYLRDESVVVAAAVPAAAVRKAGKTAGAGGEEAPAKAANSEAPPEGAPAAPGELEEQYWLTLGKLTKDHAVGIHYKGGGEVTVAVLGGQVDFACNNAPTVIPQVKANRLRALFVTPSRLDELPGVPSAAEAGYPDMAKIVGWTALMGPNGLPKPVVDAWVKVFAQLAKDPDWQAGNARIGGIPAIRPPKESYAFVKEQYDLYYGLATSLKIRQ